LDRHQWHGVETELSIINTATQLIPTYQSSSARCIKLSASSSNDDIMSAAATDDVTRSLAASHVDVLTNEEGHFISSQKLQ